MLKPQSKDNQLLFITSILVLLMGIPTFYSLTENDKLAGEQPKNTPAVHDRSPSSVPTSETIVKVQNTLMQFTEYDLNCSKKGHPIKQVVTGSFVQLQGKNCLKNFKDGDVEIFNKSNGYTASTLNSGPDKYQTDLIQLKNGENEIVIRYREHSGKFVEDVVRIQSTQI